MLTPVLALLGLIPALVTNTYKIQHLIVGLLLIGFIASFLYKRFNLVAAFAYFYFSAHAFIFLTFPKTFYQNVDVIEPYFQEPWIGLTKATSDSFLFFNLIVLGVALLTPELMRKLYNALIYLILFNAVIILIKYYLGHYPAATINNSSMNAGLLAVFIPFWLSLKKSIFRTIELSLIIWACLITKSSTGVMGSAIAIGSFYLCQNKFKVSRKVIFSLITASVIAFLGYYMQRGVLFQGSGRYEIWSTGMRFWWNSVNIFWGSGLGTWSVYGPSLQANIASNAHIQHIDGWFWMHNDFLQVVEESGVAGLIGVCSVFLYGLWCSKNDEKTFAALFTFGCVASIQPQLHYLFLVLCGCMFLARAFDNNRKFDSVSTGTMLSDVRVRHDTLDKAMNRDASC